MYHRPFLNRGEVPCTELHIKKRREVPTVDASEEKAEFGSVHLRKREVERSVGAVTERGTQATAAVASAVASASPWAHEKRISRDIQHHKQVRACVRAFGAACLLARGMHVRSATQALQQRQCKAEALPEPTHD